MTFLRLFCYKSVNNFGRLILSCFSVLKQPADQLKVKDSQTGRPAEFVRSHTYILKMGRSAVGPSVLLVPPLL